MYGKAAQYMATSSFIPNWRQIVRYLLNPKTDLSSKVLVVLAIAYLLWPFELLPDILPFLGWLDDFGLLGLVYWYVRRAAERYVVEEGKRAMAEKKKGESE
jgi:uncharacterized membrane protein YkvA (DUF1232 family)